VNHLPEEFPSVGTIFEERFELLEVLGAGGLATAFKALQLDADRLVVLKILHHLVAEDQEFKQRFLNEARILASISHANIVRVYHLGVSELGNPYLVMEFVQGCSLRQLLDAERRIEPLRAFSIARQICDALSLVHDSGIVHRDIKPENVLLVDKPATDTVKIIDFGLARNAQSEQKLTATGVLIGSPKYMSPEQCRGLNVDPRADIYAVTVCLYEMLTGEAPFDASSPMGIIYKHVHEPIDVLKARAIKGVAPALETLILAGMAKSPEKRIQSAGEMQELLSKAIDGQWSQPQDPTAGRFFPGGRPLVLILCPVIISLLLIATVYNRLLQKQAGSQISAAKSEEENRSREIKKLKSIISHSKDPGEIQDVALQVRYLNHLLSLGHEQMYSSLGKDREDAEMTFSDAIRFCDCITGNFCKNHSSACYALRGVSRRRQGKFVEADADFNCALKLANAQNENRDIELDILFQRALLRIQTRNFKESADDLCAGVAIFDSIPTIDKFMQSLDKKGRNRPDTLEEIAHTLRLMQPESPDEAVQMVKLSNLLAKKMSSSFFRKTSEGKKVLEFSRSLLSRIKDNEPLKAETMALTGNLEK
jgi:serine/threonine protein kinase